MAKDFTIRNFVDKHIYSNVTNLMNAFLLYEPERYDDIENMYITHDDDGNELEDQDIKDITQWYRISNYLYEKLSEKGYIVFDIWDEKYWGRETYGQLIEDDYVIEDIYKDLMNGSK
jgi:hypothetical protein